MCQFASFVLTKDRVFWLDESDSHEEIINKHQLHADGVNGPNILRVEITPPQDGDLGDLSRWTYKVDQDITPDWADGAEERARIALAQRFLKEFKVVGNLYLTGCTGLKALPDNLKVGGNLSLDGCTGLKALPDNLKVGGYLSLNGCTGLKALPDNLKVGGYLYLPKHLRK